MDKYVLNLRHRPRLDESIEMRHLKFMDAMSQVDAPWGYRGRTSPNVVINSAELVSVVQLKELSQRGLRSYITYSLRNEKYLRDAAQYDDMVIIEFKPQTPDLSDFVRHIFPLYIEAFECYRATIGNRSVLNDDWPSIVKLVQSTGKDVDGRDGIYRISEINYFDGELCSRAFRLAPSQIVNRLSGKVEHVSELYGGVMLIYSARLLPINELLNIHSEVKAILEEE